MRWYFTKTGDFIFWVRGNWNGILNCNMITCKKHRHPILNPCGSYIQTAVSEHFLSNSHSVSHIGYLSQLKHLDMNAIVLGKHVRRMRTSFIEPKPSSLWEWTNVTNYNHYWCNLYLFLGLFFLAATPYHDIPCNFRLLLYSSIYSVYSWFLLINLMKTVIGQSKYCIPHPLSRCLISLCISLFDFNSIIKKET